MSDQKPKDTLPSYTQLFGGMDFATGKHCRSVLSPAAYFVDLMQMKDDTNTEVEGKRRKDIDDIPLDCENTLTTIPYLDVVNEVLVTKAAADHEDDSSMDKDAAKKATAAKAYKRLAEAKYPLNLPFNLSQQRIADNLEYFNRDSLDLYKAFASSVQDESVQAKTAAREYLKLSSQEYELLAKEEITADSVKPYWGLESTENLSSLEDSTTFVNKSNLSGKDLQALLFHDLSESEITAGKAANFFINKLDAQPSTYITIAEIENEDSNEEEEKLQLSDNKSPLTARHYDRLHRFIRLARHLKWSFSDLDWVIRSACGYKLDASALQIIAVIKYLEENYRLPIEELCAFWADIKAEGHGEKSMPGDLYNRTFNNGYNLKISALDENDKAATKNRLMSAIELKEADYLYLHDQLTNAGPTLTLESSSLTLLYRFAKISAMLELTVKELFIVLEIVDQNRKYINTEQFGEVIPLTAGENHSIDILLNNNVTDTLWLLQLVSGIVAWLKDNAMSVKQLEFICSSKSEGHVEGVLSNDERRELFAELKGQFESILLTPAQLQSGITDVVIAAELLTQLSTFEQGIADSHGLILQEPNSMAIAELLKIIFEKRLQISEVDFAKLKLTNDEQNLLFDLLRKKKYTKTIAAQAAEEATGQEASDKIHQIVASQQLFDYFSLPENAETFHLGNEAFSTKEEEIFATIAAKIANYQKALASVGTEAVQVVDKIKSLAQQQQQTLYTTLENSFGLSYDLVKLIGDLVFKTPDESAQAVVTHFMQPILKAVDPQATKDAALMTSFRRLQQLLLLVAKAGLSSPEAAALFANQQTADKLPEKLKLPAGFPLKVDAAYQATNGDIYLFADESYVGYDLRLMSVDATTNLKDEGRDLVIVALVGTNLHIRIFDASGEKVVDKAENELIGGETLTALKQRLSPFPDESTLTEQDKQEIIRNATSIAGHTRYVCYSGEDYTIRTHGAITELELAEGFKTRIDAALTDSVGDSYLFSNKKFLDLKNNSDGSLTEWGKVKNNIQTNNRIDAGYVVDDGTIYLFSGDQYTRYSGGEKQFADEGYPLSILENWNNEGRLQLPEGFSGQINAVFKAKEGESFFFYDDLFISSHDLRLMSVDATTDLKDEGRDLVIVALVGTNLHIRIFDASGEKVVDKAENELIGGETLTALKQRLSPFPDESTLSEQDKQEIIRNATSIAGHTHPDNVKEVKERWGKVDNHLAREGRVDAAFSATNGKSYLFSGEQYVRYSGDDFSYVDEGYPQRIKNFGTNEHLENVHAFFQNGLDALFAGEDGNTYMFKANKFWVSGENALKQVHAHWGKVRNNLASQNTVDAAFMANGRVYLFSGDQYVRYSQPMVPGSSGFYVDEGYPKRIAANWNSSEQIGQLPEDFDKGVEAAFTAPDGISYFFTGSRFVSSRQDAQIQTIKQHWGKVRNNVETNNSIDAAIVYNEKTYLFCGDQYIRYSGTDYTSVDEGYPKKIAMNWSPEGGWGEVPNEFQNGLSAALADDDQNVYLFAGNKFIQLGSSNKSKENNSAWGRVKNNLVDLNRVDAAFAASDGRTYLFSGNQFVRYSKNNYSEVDEGYPKSIRGNWGNLPDPFNKHIDAAFIFPHEDEDRLYIFSGKQYVRYSNNGYGQIDEGYPKTLGDEDEEDEDSEDRDFEKPHEKSDKNEDKWVDGFPKYAFQYGFGAVLVDEYNGQPRINLFYFKPNKHQYLKHYYYNQKRRKYHWTNSKPVSQINLGPFTYVQAAVAGSDGENYLFCDNQYGVLKGDFEGLSQPESIKSFWGKVANNFAKFNRIDSAYQDENGKDENGKDENGKTYLFCHDQYIRYSGAIKPEAPDFYVDEGYPKKISDNWSNEDTQIKIPDKFTPAGTAVLRDAENRIYVFQGNEYSLQGSDDKKNINSIWGKVRNNLAEQNSVDTAFAFSDAENRQRIYLFCGDQFIRYSGNIMPEAQDFYADEGYPLTIETGWSKEGCPLPLPANLEGRPVALFQDDRLEVYLFEGKQYLCTGQSGPASIKAHWGLVQNNIERLRKIDSAFVHNQAGNARTYIFCDDQYYRYSQGYAGYVDEGYPKKISGIGDHDQLGFLVSFSSGVDALFQAADKKIYAFNNERKQFISIDMNQPASQAIEDVWGRVENLIADEGKIDAAYVAPNHKTYLFYKNQYICYDNIEQQYVNEGYPHTLANWKKFEGTDLPALFYEGIDAIFSDQAGKTYFFAKSHFVDSDDPTTPMRINETWGKVRNNFNEADKIDAAFMTLDGKTYLFADDQYVCYSAGKSEYVDEGYPKAIAENWGSNLPDDYRLGLDGAMVFEGRTYLFKNDTYVRYSDPKCRRIDEGYPRKLAGKWDNVPEFLLSDIQLFYKFRHLSGSFSEPDYPIRDFVLNRSEDSAELAQITGWPQGQIDYLLNQCLAYKKGSLAELQTLFDLKQVFDLAHRLGTLPESLEKDIWVKIFNDSSALESAADHLYGLLKATTDKSEWDGLAKGLHNKINLRKRDALMAYVMHISQLDSPRDLYDQLLIDVEMGECAITSRIKEAIACMQLYYHRSLINLEQVRGQTGEKKERKERKEFKAWWYWMKNYRLWEANRKVFLYPENYIRPELRQNKSPAFQKLEEALLQNDINDETVQKAYKDYLEEYTAVSSLIVAGGYVYNIDNDTKANDTNAIMFGRTRSEPHTFYYRIGQVNTNDVPNSGDVAINWEAWQELEIIINADRVYPIYAFNRLFVFWIELKESNETTFSGSSVGPEDTIIAFHPIINYSFYNLNKKWKAPQKLGDVVQHLNRNRSIPDTTKSRFFGKNRSESDVKNITLFVTNPSAKVDYDNEEYIYIDYADVEKTTHHHYFAGKLTSDLEFEQGSISSMLSAGGQKFPDEIFDRNPSSYLQWPTYFKETLSPYWFSFSLKGGNFLCKPDKVSQVTLNNIKNIEELELGGAKDSNKTLQHVDCGFQAPDKRVYFFSGDFYVCSDDKSRKIKIGQRWGNVKNTLEDKPLKQAFVYDDKTYFLLEDVYFHYEHVEESNEQKNYQLMAQDSAVDIKEFKWDQIRKEGLKEHDLSIVSVENDEEGKKEISQFQSEVEKNTCKFSLLILGIGAPGSIRWIVAGFDLNGEFKQPVLDDKNDPDGALRNELVKDDKEQDKQKIIDLAINITGRSELKRDFSAFRKKINIEDKEHFYYDFSVDGTEFESAFILDEDIYLWTTCGLFTTVPVKKFLEINKLVNTSVEGGDDVVSVEPVFDDWKTLDAAFVDQDSVLYITSGDHYISYENRAWSGPQIIKDTWGTELTQISNAFLGADGKLHLFAGDKYANPDNGYKLEHIKIKWGRANILERTGVSAAFVDTNNDLYLFTQGKYVRYSYTADAPDKYGTYVDAVYPSSVKDDWGISEPNAVTAAYTQNGKAYIIVGNAFYAYKDTKQTPKSPDEKYQYPQIIKQKWGNLLGYFNDHIDGAAGLTFESSKELYLFSGNEFIHYTSDWPYDLTDTKYSIIRLTTNTAQVLNQKLFANGVGGLLDLETQKTDELPKFKEDTPTEREANNINETIFYNANYISEAPESDTLDLRSANGLYYWEIFFHTPFLIAQALNKAQKFEEAKRWYEFIFDPTFVPTDPTEQQDNDRPYWRFVEFNQNPANNSMYYRMNSFQLKTYKDDPFDPHAIAALRTVAYRKSIVMIYIDNLLDWGDMLFRQYTMESINEARMYYVLAYDLLGKRPENLGTQSHSPAKSYAQLEAEIDLDEKEAFDDLIISLENKPENGDPTDEDNTVNDSILSAYFHIPENELFVEYWDRVEDRLNKIRNCLNIEGVKQALPLFQPPIDPTALVQAAAGGGIGQAMADFSIALPHYRFSFALAKAKELVGRVIQFGSTLLSTLEKKDAEELSLLRNTQERSIQQITLQIKQDQLGAQLETIESLRANLIAANSRYNHYDTLIDEDLSDNEQKQIDQLNDARTLFIVSQALGIASSISYSIPQMGSPFAITFGGVQFGAVLGTASSATGMASSIYTQDSTLTSIKGGYERRKEDWKMQRGLAEADKLSIEKQISGAVLQKAVAQKEIELTKKQIKQNESIETFMKSKFTNKQLYQWMAGKLSGLYFQTYQMALDLAKAAQKSFQFEKGLQESEVNFIGGYYWDSLHKGLLAGEQLQVDLDRMEKAYLEKDKRRFEISKTVSLMLMDPLALLNLKEKRVCEFTLHEQLFDYDFPGHYCRQIKTVSVTFPAVVGPYENINATLTQLSHRTLLEPDKAGVAYLLNPEGDQPLSIRADWRTNQQIALSRGVNDSGLFQLNFQDERYLPFEGTGAVLSSWRLELNGHEGALDLDTLSDVIIRVEYTALQGGEVFAGTVKKLLRPVDKAKLFNLAHDFSEQWRTFMTEPAGGLSLPFEQKKFSNMSKGKIKSVYMQYELTEAGEQELVGKSMLLDDTLELKHGKYENELSLGVKDGQPWVLRPKRDSELFRPEFIENIGLVLVYESKVSF